MNTQRIALYGGTFDPVHCGHLIVARAIRESLGLDRVVLLPSACPPHKGRISLTDGAHRAEMVRLAVEGETGFELSDYDLARPGPTYTFDTVSHFRQELGAACELHWIIGADSLAELATWRRAAELVDICRILVAPRADAAAIDWDRLRTAFSDAQIARLRGGVLPAPVIAISATDIRRRVREGKSIRFLVPDAVRGYIEDKGLYRT